MSMVSETEVFINNAEWLDHKIEAPAIEGLRKAAEALDKRFTGSMWAEYNKQFRYLRKLAPAQEVDDSDDLDRDLSDDDGDYDGE